MKRESRSIKEHREPTSEELKLKLNLIEIKIMNN